MVKPPVLRTKSATTKVTEAEYARLESLAEASGVNMSEWMRGRLLGSDHTRATPRAFRNPGVRGGNMFTHVRGAARAAAARSDAFEAKT